MTLLTPALAALLVLASVPASAQSLQDLGSFKLKKPAPGPKREPPPEMKALVDRIAKEIEAASGHQITSPKFEGREHLENAPFDIKNDGADEVRRVMTKPIFGFLANMGVEKAIGGEIQFWKNRGYGVRLATRRKMAEMIDSKKEAAGAPKDGDVTMTEGVKIYAGVSDVLYDELVPVPMLKAMNSGKAAYLAAAPLQAAYDKGQKRISDPDVNTTFTLRNIELQNCGFGNTKKAVQPDMGMVPAMLVPQGDEPVSEGSLQRNIQMFRGLAAVWAWEGITQKLIDPGELKVDELKKAADHDQARYGVQHLEWFMAPANVKTFSLRVGCMNGNQQDCDCMNAGATERRQKKGACQGT